MFLLAVKVIKKHCTQATKMAEQMQSCAIQPEHLSSTLWICVAGVNDYIYTNICFWSTSGILRCLKVTIYSSTCQSL